MSYHPHCAVGTPAQRVAHEAVGSARSQCWPAVIVALEAAELLAARQGSDDDMRGLSDAITALRRLVEAAYADDGSIEAAEACESADLELGDALERMPDWAGEAYDRRPRDRTFTLEENGTLWALNGSVVG